MEWTTEKPTQTGWYKVSDGHWVTMVEINKWLLGKRRVYISGEPYAFHDFAYWMGPMPMDPPPTISAEWTKIEMPALKDGFYSEPVVEETKMIGAIEYYDPDDND